MKYESLDLKFNENVSRSMSSVSLMLDNQGIILYSDSEAVSLFGKSASELCGSSFNDLNKENKLFYIIETELFYLPELLHPQQSIVSTATDRLYFLSLNEVMCASSGNSQFILNILDITERRRDFKNLYRGHRAVRMIAELRKAMQNVTEEYDLYKLSCDTIVNAGYRMAWIGLITAENGTRVLQPAASAGFTGDYLEKIKIDLDDPVLSSGPSGQAVQSCMPVVMQDIQKAPEFAPWREAALHLGYNSSVAVPMKFPGGVIGTVNIYSGERQGFDNEETELLETLVNDIAQTTELIRIRKLTESVEKEKRAMQDYMIRIQKMEAIGTMAGGIAHDFNNLLNIIKGYTQILLMKETPFREDLKEIDKASRQAANLTKQLLLLGRQNVRDQTLININNMLSKNINMLERLYGKNTEFIISLDEDIPSTEGNEGQLEQVILNIMLNALDALESGISPDRKLYIKTGLIDVSNFLYIPFSRPGEYIQISIEDNGCGIPHEVVDRIFDPFFTTKENGKGTGLGLAVAQSVISTHNGWINVYSEPKEGTVFKIYLPVACAEQKREEAAESGSDFGSVRGSGTVMVIEDDPSLRNMLSGFLEGQGFKVIRAAGAEEAVTVFSSCRDRIRIVISDVVLNDGDGISVSHVIRKDAPEMPFIFVSGYHEVKSRIFDDSFRNRFIQKPYDLNVLLQLVQKTLSDH